MVNSATVCQKSAKQISLAVLVVQNVSIVLMMGYSKTVRNSGYISSTAVLTAELLKLLINTVIESVRTGASKGSFSSQLWNLETFKLAVPALLYVIQNNLTFLALGNLSVPMYQVTAQGRILTTAALSRLLLNKKISSMQYVSLVLLASGVAVIQFAALDKSTLEDSKDTDQSTMLGLVAVLICCFTSSLAGVYFEKMVKKSNDVSVYMRNIQLSSWSILLGSFTVFFHDFDNVKENGFFHGYDGLVLAIVVNQAVSGLTISLVMKYADNILKGFATSISIFISSGLSWWIMDAQLDTSFGAGASIVAVSVWMYAKFSPMKTNANVNLDQAPKGNSPTLMLSLMAVLAFCFVCGCIAFYAQLREGTFSNVKSMVRKGV